MDVLLPELNIPTADVIVSFTNICFHLRVSIARKS